MPTLFSELNVDEGFMSSSSSPSRLRSWNRLPRLALRLFKGTVSLGGLAVTGCSMDWAHSSASHSIFWCLYFL